MRRDKIDDLKQKFPPTNYQSTAEWAKAVRTEILSFSLPAKPRFDEAPELGYRADELQQAARQWRTEQEVKGSVVYSRELLEYELKETERINAMIMKQTRHCAELKLWVKRATGHNVGSDNDFSFASQLGALEDAALFIPTSFSAAFLSNQTANPLDAPYASMRLQMHEVAGLFSYT